MAAPTVSVVYTAKSLEDVAKDFDNRAERARAHAARAKPQAAKLYAEEAATWEAAAHIIRCLKIEERSGA